MQSDWQVPPDPDVPRRSTNTGQDDADHRWESAVRKAPGDQRGATSVVLVDDHTVVREGLCALIAMRPDFDVVGQATDLTEAAALAVTPDVVVIDLDMGGSASDENVIRLRELFPVSGILVLTNVSHPVKVQAALAGGADGYMLKTATSTDLLFGIRAVAEGETYLQPSLGVELARWHSPRQGMRLSPKEEEIVGLLAVGHTNTDIAQRLGVSVRTVETHRARILQKLGRRTRAELFQYALQAGLIDPS